MRDRIKIIWLAWVFLFVGVLVACTFWEIRINIFLIGLLLAGTIAGGFIISDVKEG